ncbi:MAG: OmpH family outer membrane protein [Bacteroidales bacterium]|jgi:outer membrane protein|nr:OmpH family outer membrane protein [Bacteroidales bacterium]
MKKFLILIAVALLCATTGYAQKAKFGHVDYGTIMKEMPGIDTAQQALLEYQQELEAVGKQMADEFKLKQAEYADLTNKTTSSAILKVKEDELMKLYQRLQDFVSSSEMDLQAKQIELLKPFQERLLAAIKTVAEKEKYTYVFDVTMCAFHNDADDLTAAVRTELGIK